MTITKTPRRDLQRFIDNPRMDPHAVALLRRETDMPAPPQPWGNPAWRPDVEPNSEPVERQAWGPLVNWRALAIGLVAIAVAVFAYVGMPA